MSGRSAAVRCVPGSGGVSVCPAGLLLSAVCRAQEVRGSVDVAEGADAVLRCRFDPAQVDPAEASFYWSHRSDDWDNVAIEEKPFRKRYR